MKYIFAFIIIINILACRMKMPSYASNITKSDTVIVYYFGNDSLDYKATYLRSSMDSVRRGLIESAHPIKEEYIEKYYKNIYK